METATSPNADPGIGTSVQDPNCTSEDTSLGVDSGPSDEQVVVGMVFRDTRQEALERVQGNLRKLRKREGKYGGTLPERTYVRILKVSDDRETIWCISTEDPCSLEQSLPMRMAIERIRLREWIRTDVEPIAALRFPEENLSVAQLRCRDRNVKLIQPLIDLGNNLVGESQRWRVIRAICKDTGAAPMKVYRVLRRFLQGGRNKNALAGRWFRRSLCGGRGSRVLCKIEVRGGVRPKPVGRPRLDGHRPFLVTDVDVRKIVAGAAKYYHTPLGGDWHRAWLLTLADSYLELNLQSSVPVAGQLSGYTPDCYPSEAQFRYWAKTDKMVIARTKSRIGEKKYNLTARPLDRKTEEKATGPGGIFQIDATPFDIVAVHQVTRRPIGKLLLYLVTDAFSHLIVGYFAHLGNAGFDPISLALLATAENKVDLCRRFGIEISGAEWPAACLPDLLAGDSELASLRAHALVEAGAIGLTIVPAYRADLKGLAEALNSSVKRQARHMPGYTSDVRQRATIQPDVEAALDVLDMNQVIICWIRQTNRLVVDDYRLTDEMIRDRVVPTPINLWNWGIRNRGGRGCCMNMEYLKRLCLPTANGRITRRGLEFRDRYYVPQVEIELPQFEAWRCEAASRGWNETVTYHPARVGELWLHFEGRLVPMKLQASSRTFETWSAADLDGFEAEQARDRAEEQGKNIPALAILEAEKLRIADSAIRKTEEVRGTVNKRKNEQLTKPADRADQIRISTGMCVASQADSVPPTEMAEEDENAIIEALKRSSVGDDSTRSDG